MFKVVLSDSSLDAISGFIGQYVVDNFNSLDEIQPKGEITELQELANYLHSLANEYYRVPLTIGIEESK